MTNIYDYEISPGWKGLLASLGIASEDVLRRARLPPDLLHRADSRVPAEQFFAFAHAVYASVNDPEFPIRLAESLDAEWFSPPVFASLCCPNLKRAVVQLARFKPLMAPIRLEVEGNSDELCLRFHWIQAAISPPEWLSGSEALFIVRLARLGTRENVRPRMVILPRLPQKVSAYEEFLGTRIQVGDEVEVRFSRDDAEKPFLTANQTMWNIFEPELRQRLEDLETSASFGRRTRAILLQILPSGEASVESVGRHLAVSSRTLQRKLRSEGTTFQLIVKETREQLARHYLANTRLSSTEIAYLLGFEEVTSFFRAFHAWTGETPETIRNQLQA